MQPRVVEAGAEAVERAAVGPELPPQHRSRTSARAVRGPVEALPDRAELPRAVAQIQLAERHRRFARARQVRGEADVARGDPRIADLRQRLTPCRRLVDRHAEHDPRDLRGQAPQIDLEHAERAAAFGKPHRPVGTARLVVEDHVVIAADLAAFAQQVCGNIEVHPRRGHALDPDGHGVAGNRRIPALLKIGHHHSLVAIWRNSEIERLRIEFRGSEIARRAGKPQRCALIAPIMSWKVRPVVRSPIAFMSQPPPLRVSLAMTWPVCDPAPVRS